MNTIDTPTAEDVRRIMRRSNWLGIFLFAVLLLAVGASVYFAAGGRTASRDSYSATAVQLANNDRNSCITERRNAELDAIRQGIFAGLKAQKAGLLEEDAVELAKQVALFDGADADALAASTSLAPKVLNSPPPLGCGPPIVTVSDIPER
jgi:uncharacterized membrane protein